MTYELIALRAGGREICVAVQSVREVRGWTEDMRSPHGPGCVRGVVNLLGAALPIVDLGCRLGFPPSEPTEQHAILVLETGGRMVGLLVDAVSDTFIFDEKDVQDASDAAARSTRQYITALIAEGDRLVSMADALPAMQCAA